MAGLVPAIHALLLKRQDVDARHRAGHDGARGSTRLEHARELVPTPNEPDSILRVEPPELLHALSGIHLRGEDIALAVDRDVVQRRELADLPARAAEARQRIFAGARDDAHLAVH